MNYDSEKIYELSKRRGFSLIETITSLIILAMVSSSVFVVISRNVDAAANARQRMRAFEVARDKMEGLLTYSKINEQGEYGVSENYPDIEWQTKVESFYEPQTDHMWARVVTSAQYTDTNDVVQTVELTHWLTDLSKKEVKKILEQQRKEQRWLEANPEVGSLEKEEPTDEMPDTEATDSEESSPGSQLEKPENMSDEMWQTILKLLGR